MCPDSEDALLGWHLHYQVDIMRHGHEFGKRRPAKDGMVGCVEVHNEEADLLAVEVLGSAKLNREGDFP